MEIIHTRGVSITAKMTVSEGHAAKPDDPQASLRSELLGQLVAAQFEIEAAIADLTRDGAPASAVANTRSQLAAVGALRQQLIGADARTLASMRGDIAATVAACQTAAQQARAAADEASASNLSNYAQSARNAVHDVMRGMKDFDRDLRFANAQDEAEYRRREDERRAYIDGELAKHTPQGDLNASGGAVGQMTDAAAHGAAANPEFQRRWDKLVVSAEALRAQLVRDGKDVSDFDKHLREDLRRIMKSKGLSDAQIDEQFAAHQGNPIETAKAFVAEQKDVLTQHDLDRLDMETQAAGARSTVTVGMAKQVIEQATPPASAASTLATSLGSIGAELKAMGIDQAEHDSTVQPTHGVAAATMAPRPKGAART